MYVTHEHMTPKGSQIHRVEKVESWLSVAKGKKAWDFCSVTEVPFGEHEAALAMGGIADNTAV